MHKTIQMFSSIGVQMTAPRKRIILIRLEEYVCIKPFGEIPQDHTVFAGFVPEYGGYVISATGFDGITIGSELFREHFELDYGPMPLNLIWHSTRAMQQEIRRLSERKYFV